MPKAKIIKPCAFLLAAWVFAGVGHAQPVLGELIQRAKTMKQPPAPSVGVPVVAKVEEGAQRMALWSIAGVNNTLYAEIWQGDAIHRLLLNPGVKLPTGWEVVSADRRSVTLKLGRETRRLYPIAPGSTGWEFAQTPRVPVSTVPTLPGAHTFAARMAAGNLPPMVPMGHPAQAMPSAPGSQAVPPQATPADATSTGGVGHTAR